MANNLNATNIDTRRGSQMNMKLETDLNYIPPRWELCEIHRKASYMRNIDEDKLEEYKKCVCCGNIYDAPVLSVTDDPNKFAHYGFGITLYFNMMKYITLLFCVFLVNQ